MKSVVDIIFWLCMGGALCAIPVYLRAFSCNLVDISLDHYAESPQVNGLIELPWNSLVNLAYGLCGIFWLGRIRRTTLAASTASYVNAFSCMSIFYAPIQFARIATRSCFFAILDQWYTLPIFSWVVVLFLHTTNRGERWWPFVVLASCSSYFLVLLTPIGFDIALAVHILVAVSCGVVLQMQRGSATSLCYFFCAVICCLGFVTLKLGDHHLAKMHPFFRVLSGHFWSKICDACQIHFVLHFFIDILSGANAETVKRSE